MDELQPLCQTMSREELLRQIEQDLSDPQLRDAVTIALTWAKSRGISLDTLERCQLGPP